MTSLKTETPSLIGAIDTLADAEGLLDCAFMAAADLSQRECNAMQQVLDAALARLRECKADLYAIHDGEAA